MVNLNDLLKFLTKIDKLNKTFIYNNSSIQPTTMNEFISNYEICVTLVCTLHLSFHVSKATWMKFGWRQHVVASRLPKPHLQWEPYLPQSTKGSWRMVMNGKVETSIGNENWKTKVLWVSYHYLHHSIVFFESLCLPIHQIHYQNNITW